MTHYSIYIAYTGAYALCKVEDPTDPGLPFNETKDEKRVTCPECKKLLPKKDIYLDRYC